MASSFEKSVKGATKIKLAAPKSKYVEHILVATHAGEQGVAEVFRVLQNRLRDSTWTIVFKSLIVTHFMIREGEPDVTLRHLSRNPKQKLAINNFTEVQTQGRNIRAYADYLVSRVNSYASTKIDMVRSGENRLVRLSVEKGLLRETESVQDMIRALLRCDFLTLEPENDISLTAFRLLLMDLLVLFHVMNEGLVNILQHFFEMSKPDAERTLHVYRTFVRQTENVVKYLSVARNYEHVTRLEIPTLKHAPTGLAAQLEAYVKEPDFEAIRQQYLATKGIKGSKPTNGASKATDSKAGATSKSKTEAFPEPKGPVRTAQKAPAPDLIDFFESIDQNQTQMNTNPFQQPQPQAQQFPQQQMPGQMTGFNQTPFGPAPTGVPGQQNAFSPQGMPMGSQQPFGGMPGQQTGMPNQQQTFSPVAAQSTGNPFAQMASNGTGQQGMQPNFTGAGFGGYTPQNQNRFTPGLSSIQQNQASSFQSPQQQPFSPGGDSPASTNPFRQSMMPTGSTGASFGSLSTAPTGMSQQSTNPFAKPQNTATPPNNTPFSAPSSQFSNMSLGNTQQPAAPIQVQPTGTNPFAKPMGTSSPGQQNSPFSSQGVTTHVTGSTNPFRQSQFVNAGTGQGWQSGPQGTIGGLSGDQIQTTSIFPRPGGQQAGQNPMQSQPTGWPPQQ